MLSKVTPELVDQYTSRLKSTSSEATQKRAMSSLRRFFDWAQSEGHVAKTPFNAPGAVNNVANSSIPAGTSSIKPFAKALAIASFTAGMGVFSVVLVQRLKIPIPFKVAPAQVQNIANIPTNLPVPTQLPVPRQPIANNSPPVIPSDDLDVELDENGDIVIADTSITLSTTDSSGGDITINPDSSGNLNLLFEGVGENFINAQAANLTTGVLYYGYVGSNAIGYDLIKLQSGSTPTTRFSVDGAGNTFVGGSLTVNDNLNLNDLNLSGDLKIGGVTRFNSLGRLTSLTGYYQDSGVFEIDQGASDNAKIEKILTLKEGSSSSNVLTLILDETDLLIGSDSDTLVLKRLNPSGNGYALFVDEGNAKFDGNIDYVGTLTDVSDIRLKENFGTIENPLNILKNIDGFTFNMIGNEKIEIGVSAQQVQKVLPEAVSVIDKKEGYLGVSYTSFVPVIIEGIKQLDSKVSYLSQTLLSGATFTKNIASNQVGYLENNILSGSLLVLESISTGSIEVAENISAGTAQLGSLVVNNIRVTRVETELLSPVPGGNLVIDLDNNKDTANNGSGRLIFQGESGTEVASVDSLGNAEFAGRISSQELNVEYSATIAGNLTARTITADKIVSDSLVTLEDIEQVLREAQDDQALLDQTQNWTVNTATDSATLDNIAVSTLFVTQTAAIKSLSISDSISLGPDLIIQSLFTDGPPINSIDTLRAPLHLQSLALAPIKIMAGAITIQTNGDLEIVGNVYIAGNIEAAEATFESLEVGKLVIAGNTTSSSAQIVGDEITTNATAGKATIIEGEIQIIINNPNISDYSLVYVTPTSSTLNQVLYVKSKEEGSFTVGFEESLGVDVEFNWWVVDLIDN